MILDRSVDKNADIGQFELAFKQPQVHVPPYIGMNLSVDGNHIKKPSWMTRKSSESQSMARMTKISSKTDTGLGTNMKSSASKLESSSKKSDSDKKKSEGMRSNSECLHAPPSDSNVTPSVAKSQPVLSLTHKKDKNEAHSKTTCGQIKNNLPTQRSRQRSARETCNSRIHRDLGKSVEHKRTHHKRHASLPPHTIGSANSLQDLTQVSPQVTSLISACEDTPTLVSVTLLLPLHLILRSLV